MEDIQLLKAPPIYRQIVAKFEEQIYSGVLRRGDRIAPTVELAKKFGVGRNAVQQALSILAERGLIERRAKRGTFVCEQINSRTIGVIFGYNIVTEQYSQFNRLLYGEIVRQAQLNNWRTALYFPVTTDNYGQYLSQLERDITAGKLRAVVNFDKSAAMLEVLDKSSCVAVNFTNYIEISGDFRSSVTYRGSAYLLEHGYRNIALVIQTDRRASEQHLQYLKAAYDDKGINYNGRIYRGDVSTERQGIELAEEIMTEDDWCPDALLVLNDTVCRGMIFALMLRGLNIPQDIGLMAQTNKGYEILCPVPLTSLELQPEKLVKAELERLWAKMAGEKLSPAVILPELIPGKSCGES